MENSSQLKLLKASAEEAQFLSGRLETFNSERLGLTGPDENLSFILKNDQGKIAAGIAGILYFHKCLYISAVFVHEDLRGQNIGMDLLKRIEDEAKERGVTVVHLDSFDFQAKDFYIKSGYEVFGVLEDCPPGHTRYYFKKYLK